MRLKMNRDLLKTRELFTTNLWQKNFNYPEIILEGYVFSRIKYAFWSFPIRIYPLWDILTLNFSSVDQSCLTLSDPMDSSTPGFPVHHQLPELAQTHIHQISDAIQPSHPLLSPYPSALSFPASGASPKSQLFTSGGQSIGVSASTSVLPMKTQDWFPLWWTGWISLQSKELSRVFSNTTVQKHQFFGAQLKIMWCHLWIFVIILCLKRKFFF